MNLQVARGRDAPGDVAYHALTLMTFGQWDDVLAEPLPPVEIRFSYAMAHYTRGIAYAAKGKSAEAQSALDAVKEINAATPKGADGKTGSRLPRTR